MCYRQVCHWRGRSIFYGKSDILISRSLALFDRRALVFTSLAVGRERLYFTAAAPAPADPNHSMFVCSVLALLVPNLFLMRYTTTAVGRGKVSAGSDGI